MNLSVGKSETHIGVAGRMQSQAGGWHKAKACKSTYRHSTRLDLAAFSYVTAKPKH